ncbi:hypothetical protein HDV01_002674 [Terramyces sp. JEL0728]|nr:hypothetical protein HDV01_002674 [Terramyces sp. JEL0728]
MESNTKDVEMMMEKETDKRVYWVKYLDYQAVGINTHFFHESTAKWVERWLNVGDLIAAYRVDSVIAETSPELLSLHLPVGAERSALPEDCFANETDSTLDNGCLLSDLGTIGTKSKKPLIIKSRTDDAIDKSLLFRNQTEIPMSVGFILNWLCGSPNSSSADLNNDRISSQEQINTNQQIDFPLAGREESLEHLAKCFSTTYKERFSTDRNRRPLPVCTGIPGLGKTRLMEECSTTVLDMTNIEGKRISGIVSFGNDGNPYNDFDRLLGIQCSFAWRVLYLFFKAHYDFNQWMREKSPKNRKLLTLGLVLAVIEQYWCQKTNENILLFVGVDEYQKLNMVELALFNILCP